MTRLLTCRYDGKRMDKLHSTHRVCLWICHPARSLHLQLVLDSVSCTDHLAAGADRVHMTWRFAQ